MKRIGTALRRKRGEHGQVLILAVVALVLVILAVLLLFDVQTVIRGKIKGQNAVDAAALTGAEWQRHSLNLIGELNLVRATGALISDPYFETAVLETYRDADKFFYDVKPSIRNRSDDFLTFPEKDDFLIRDPETGDPVFVNVGLLWQSVRRVEKERFYLDTLDRLVSQLQTRISFVGPLIGFGAAQQAAKKNGISSDRDANELFYMYATQIGRGGSSIYTTHLPQKINDYAWNKPYGDMLSSILDISDDRAHGIAAGTRFQFSGMPTLSADPPSEFTSLLGNKSFYDSINGRNWCNLDPYLHLDFSGSWWSSFQCDYESSFINQAEILPLHITFSYFSPEDSNQRTPYDKPTTPFYGAADHLKSYARTEGIISGNAFQDTTDPYGHGFRHKYEEQPQKPDGKQETMVTVDDSPFSPFPRERTGEEDTLSDLESINTWDLSEFTPEQLKLFLDTFLDTYNDEDTDRRYTPIPIFSWAIYDFEWDPIDEGTKRLWEGEYLRGDFKEGTDYHSGAKSFFETQQQTVTISGNMGRTVNQPQPQASDYDRIDRVFFPNNKTETEMEADAQKNAEGVSNALSRLDHTVDKIRTSAMAKPIGVIRTKKETIRPFDAGRMVLPVFTKTTLVPISLDPPEGISMLDIDWYYYLTEFVPLLSGCPTLEDAWIRAAAEHKDHLHYYWKYFKALVLISDPGFRQRGIDWLNKVVVWEKDERGNRYPVKTNRDVNCTGKGESTPNILY